MLVIDLLSSHVHSLPAHWILPCKVLQLDINGRLIRWLEPFLMGRTLCQSKCRLLLSSNQQESVICPVALFLYTNVGLTHSCPVYILDISAVWKLFVYCAYSTQKAFGFLACYFYLEIAKMQQVCSHSTHTITVKSFLPSTWCLTSWHQWLLFSIHWLFFYLLIVGHYYCHLWLTEMYMLITAFSCHLCGELITLHKIIF